MTFSKFITRSQKRLRKLRRTIVRRWSAWRNQADATSEGTYLAQLVAPKPSQRWRAAAGLGRNPHRSSEAIQALITALADPEPFVRWQAAEALAAQEAGRVFPTLVAALKASDPVRRAATAEALGRAGGEAATQALRGHLADADPRVRLAVAAALGQIADPTISAELAPLLADPNPDVVRAAAGALGRIGVPAAAASLAEALVRPDQPVLVRRALAAALVHGPHPDAQPDLLTALADPDPQVRGYAARALGQAGNEAALAPLAALRTDQSRLLKGTVGEEAARALVLLERRGRRGFATE